MCLHFCLDATSSEKVILSNEIKPDPGEDIQTRGIPRTHINLGGLKAAFSNNYSSSSGNKSSIGKASNCGPTQKTLQSFFKGSACSPSVKSPLKSTRELAKCSTGGRSVLDGFRYGKMSCSETESEKNSEGSGCDLTVATPDVQCTGLDTPETVTDTSVKNEAVEDTENVNLVSEDPELQAEAFTSNEVSAGSPEAKRPRIETPHFTSEQISDTFSNSFSNSSSTVDAPVHRQKRMASLQFSLQELTEKIRRLQDRQKQRDSMELCYRRFRAKINPGENQSAEEELKKEIRLDFTSLTVAN